MDFLSFLAIDFDFLWSQHLTQVAPTTTPPKQPLATQQQPQSAEITELMANYSAKMDFRSFPAIDFGFLVSQHLTQVAPTTTPPKQPLATKQQPQSAEITELMANYLAKMDFLSFPAIDFDFLWSQHLTQVAPTTTPPKQPLATSGNPIAMDFQSSDESQVPGVPKYPGFPASFQSQVPRGKYQGSVGS